MCILLGLGVPGRERHQPWREDATAVPTGEFGTRFALSWATACGYVPAPGLPGRMSGRADSRRGTMRVLCFLFLVLFVAVVGGFAYQNWNHEVTVTVWDRNLSLPLPGLVAI